ncbi:MAG: hypothetical protein AAB730_01480 [Patescibacteria group bacterium]
MREFFQKTGQLIKKIQHSDDRAKKRWLVLLSGILMLFVIVLWVVYLNATLPQSAGTPTGTSTEAVVFLNAPEKGFSFFKTLGLGWEAVWGGIQKNVNAVGDSVKTGWQKFKEQLNRANELNIEKPKDGN